MTWLILEMLLALAIIIGIMVWTLKARTDTPLEISGDDPDKAPVEGSQSPSNAENDRQATTQKEAQQPDKGV